jgi:SHS2 domain-containing protein
MGHRYRVFGTTADVGVTSRGRDLKEAFENQAAGMFSVMVDLRTVAKEQYYVVTASGHDNESLLASFLEELLYLFDTKHVFLKEFRITRLDGHTLDAEARGEAIDPQRHTIKTPIKAVTYHMLKVEDSPETVSTTVVYDI